MDNKIQLSPPQYLLFEKIKNSIGTDPSLCIKPIYEKKGIYYIDIITDFEYTAMGLATILIPEYDYGNIKVKVRVFWKCECTQICPTECLKGNSLKIAKKLIETALKCNPYYLASIDKPEDSPITVGDIIIIFRKKVIQFFSDDISDFFQYSNFVAQDIFSSILVDSVFCDKVKLSYSTEVIEDQRIYICDCLEEELIEEIYE